MVVTQPQAVANEVVVIYLTNQYKNNPRYQDKNGEFHPNLLPENVKTQIQDLTAGIGAVIGERQDIRVTTQSLQEGSKLIIGKRTLFIILF